jgi:hypothetical protein
MNIFADATPHLFAHGTPIALFPGQGQALAPLLISRKLAG